MPARCSPFTSRAAIGCPRGVSFSSWRAPRADPVKSADGSACSTCARTGRQDEQVADDGCADRGGGRRGGRGGRGTEADQQDPAIRRGPEGDSGDEDDSYAAAGVSRGAGDTSGAGEG